eukprot:CFRG5678T1
MSRPNRPSKAQGAVIDRSTSKHVEFVSFGPNEKFEFLKMLIKDLYSYGLPAHQVDNFLEQLTTALGMIDTTFRLEPLGFWVVRGNLTQYIQANKNVNMNKLSRTVQLATDIIKGEKDIDLVERLHNIRKTKNSYPVWSPIISQPVYHAGYTVFFFGGDTAAIWVSVLLGFAFGVLITLMKYGYGRQFVKVFPFLCSLVVGLVSGLLAGSNYTSGPCAFAMALGSTASFFPGVSLTFAVLEIAYGLHATGAVRYIFAVVSGQVLAVGIYLGNIITVTYIYDNSINVLTSGACDAGLEFQSQYRFFFYVFLFIGAVLVYEQPLSHYFPFLLTQGSTYVIYYLLTNHADWDDGLSTFVAVVCMVIISAVLTTHRVRFVLRAVSLTSMSLIVPTITLLVPGSSVVRQMYLTLVGNSSEASTQNYVFTALCIAMGLLVGEAMLATVNFSIFEVPQFRGSINNVDDDTMENPEYMKALLPGTSEMSGCLILIHKAKNLLASDLNGLSDPYISLHDGDSKKIARTRIMYNSLEPKWDEAFMIHVPSDKTSTFTFKVKDYNLLTRPTPLGQLDFTFESSLAASTSAKPVDRQTSGLKLAKESQPSNKKNKKLFSVLTRAVRSQSKSSEFSQKSGKKIADVGATQTHLLPQADQSYSNNQLNEIAMERREIADANRDQSECEELCENDQQRDAVIGIDEPIFSRRTLMCNGKTIAIGSGESTVEFNQWLQLKNDQDQGAVLISMRWLAPNYSLETLDASNMPLGQVYTNDTSHTDRCTNVSFDIPNEVKGDTEHEECTLAYSILKMKSAVRNHHGRYIDLPPEMQNQTQERGRAIGRNSPILHDISASMSGWRSKGYLDRHSNTECNMPMAIEDMGLEAASHIIDSTMDTRRSQLKPETIKEESTPTSGSLKPPSIVLPDIHRNNHLMSPQMTSKQTEIGNMVNMDVDVDEVVGEDFSEQGATIHDRIEDHVDVQERQRASASESSSGRVSAGERESVGSKASVLPIRKYSCGSTNTDHSGVTSVPQSSPCIVPSSSDVVEHGYGNDSLGNRRLSYNPTQHRKLSGASHSRLRKTKTTALNLRRNTSSSDSDDSSVSVDTSGSRSKRVQAPTLSRVLNKFAPSASRMPSSALDRVSSRNSGSTLRYRGESQPRSETTSQRAPGLEAVASKTIFKRVLKRVQTNRSTGHHDDGNGWATFT